MVGLAHEALAAGVMPPVGKAKTFAARQIDRPARQNAGQLMHIALRVAAANAQRVQFHQFTRIVFVQATVAALRLVQVKQHGWMPGAGKQQVLETAQCVGPDGIDDVMADKRAHRSLADGHIQVVEPEFGHAGQQGMFQCRIAARHEPPGDSALRHVAAEQRAAGHGGGRRNHGSVRRNCLCAQHLAGVTFSQNVARQVGHRRIETRQSGWNRRSLPAGRMSRIDLLQGPRRWRRTSRHGK